MKKLTLIIFLFTCSKLFAQPTSPTDYGLKNFIIQDKKLGAISFYVDTVNIGKRAALFIDVNGSGGLPLCLYIKAKDRSTILNTFNLTVPDKTKEDYHYIILDKPGTPFCDTVSAAENLLGLEMESIMRNYKVSDEYKQRLSLEWRVEATKKVISHMLKNNYWDKSKIVAYGFSEGGQVVPTLAVRDKRVTHVVSVVGAGLNQYFDGVAGWRIKAAKGELTHKQAQDSINSYLEKIKEIYQNPEETNKQFAGHSYKRWASFGATIPFEELRKLRIPIYMLVGTGDDNSPVLGLDYVLLDFIRLGKTNLQYETCVGCDHWLNLTTENESVNYFDEYLEKILLWVNEN